MGISLQPVPVVIMECFNRSISVDVLVSRDLMIELFREHNIIIRFYVSKPHTLSETEFAFFLFPK